MIAHSFIKLGAGNSFVFQPGVNSVVPAFASLAVLAHDLKLPTSGREDRHWCSCFARSFHHSRTFAFSVRLSIKDGEISGKHAKLLRQRGLSLTLVEPPADAAMDDDKAAAANSA